MERPNNTKPGDPFRILRACAFLEYPIAKFTNDAQIAKTVDTANRESVSVMILGEVGDFPRELTDLSWHGSPGFVGEVHERGLSLFSKMEP